MRARAKSVLAGCVKVSEAAAEVFSKFMLLYSLANSSSWMHGEEENGFSQIMLGFSQIMFSVAIFGISIYALLLLFCSCINYRITTAEDFNPSPKLTFN